MAYVGKNTLWIEVINLLICCCYYLKFSLSLQLVQHSMKNEICTINHDRCSWCLAWNCLRRFTLLGLKSRRNTTYGMNNQFNMKKGSSKLSCRIEIRTLQDRRLKFIWIISFPHGTWLLRSRSETQRQFYWSLLKLKSDLHWSISIKY